MGVSTVIKQQICEQHQDYLKIVYHLGNKVMLLKQLWNYAKDLGLARNLNEFYIQIAKLEHYEIICKEPFTAYNKKTQLQMLVLRKHAIRFIECKQSSYNVASVPVSHSNERILVSIFKNCYIQSKILPRIQNENKTITFNSIVDMLDRDCSTILLNKNEGLGYLCQLASYQRFQKELSIAGIEYEIEKMRALHQKRLEGLKKGSASKRKGKGKLNSSSDTPLNEVIRDYDRRIDDVEVKFVSPKNYRMSCFSIDTMLNCNYYIAQIKSIKNKWHVTVLMFDIYNKQNAYKIAADIACLHHMLSRFLNIKSDFKLKIGVVCLDEAATKRVKADSETLVRDFVSKEVKGMRFVATLRDWGIDDEMQKQIDVQFVDYDITNQFMDGIKHMNLMRR
ncbi:hypothetical protein [Paenibacillus sp. EPM92]|uniref:hypothetical protein n=1 Tax=Paenibacillus sp. EPM92 TaxID=1561195 RepID=UPI00191509F6|nr:hypothetical protein [Paenibacillus sp. EPM92]